MLDKHEMAIRIAFYTEIFGGEKIKRSTFSEYLWPIVSYPEKIQGLIARGFKDPHKMIASLPPILGYSFENIDAKIKGLSDRGFKDPHKMIASLPPILGYSFENIDRKLKLCRRLGACVENFLEYTIIFASMSPKNYIPILRKCRELEFNPSPKNVFKIYRAKSF